MCRDDLERATVQLWRGSGVSEGSMVTYLDWVRRFRAYCKQRGFNEESQLTLDGVARFADTYVSPRTKGSVAASTRLVCRNALHGWACALRWLKAPVPQWRQRSQPRQVSPLITAYCQHRRSCCGVKEATLQRDIETANGFLTLLRRRGRAIGKMTVADIDAFIIQLSKRYSRSTLADLCSSLRAFLRFLQTRGRISRDLAACVVAPRIRMAERPPRALPWAQVRRIIQSIPRDKAPGKRNFAMLLMMAAYGLGAAEILGLRLGDVDWKSSVLRVRRPKTGASIDLPLLPAIARALIAYLHKERPRHAEARQIFLSTVMPHNPITSGAIRYWIRQYARRSEITADMIGAHAFRHSHASRQVDAGADLKIVSDILGHRRPSSTSVYVRVALRRLRSVTLPVPQ